MMRNMQVVTMQPRVQKLTNPKHLPQAMKNKNISLHDNHRQVLLSDTSTATINNNNQKRYNTNSMVQVGSSSQIHHHDSLAAGACCHLVANLAPAHLKNAAVSRLRAQQRAISDVPDVQHVVK
eukprot:GHRQ01019227.1.p2 GENE.GHRQ01019227.1~~GHRQ01019227.1.p2  ORF type:complete len:123 (-),score=23.39 GHRQ01019227.1:131-499(-)